MQNKIYVGNLNYTAKEEELRSAFSPFGTISDVFIPKDRETGKVRGFAFVTFEDNKQAQQALEMNEKEFMGRVLKVNIAKERETSNGGNSGSRW